MTDAPTTVRTLPRYVEEHPKCGTCESCVRIKESVDSYECVLPLGNSHRVRFDAELESINVLPKTDYCSNHSALRQP